MLLALLAAAAGVGCLWKAADEFVLGATRLALIFKISPVVVGAIIVGFGTSAPELLVSGIAAAGGDIDVGVGNIIGSNIANLSLILGAAALVLPIGITAGVLRREAPLSLASVVLFAIVLRLGMNWPLGVALFVVLAGFLHRIIKGDGNDVAELTHEVEELAGHGDLQARVETLRTLAGLIITIVGAWVLVWGALRLADELGVSGGFVGVTIVAIGTSLPELVTALAAARARQTELIVGNLLGSNLFNSLAVGGTVAILGSGPIVDPSLDTLDTGFMLVVALGAYVAMRTRGRFERVEGIVLLMVFFSFLVLSYVSEAA
ncbi:MAG: calcium/sodium antiporter [Acidimicrobiales bacterium]